MGSDRLGSSGGAAEPEGRGATRAASAPLLITILGSGLVTFALSTLAPHVPWPTTTSAGAARSAFVLAFAWVGLEALVVARVARAAAPRVLGSTALLGALGLGAMALAQPTPSAAASALVALLVLAAGAGAGALVGGRIQHAGHLGVVAVISALADVASVFHEAGPTAQILDSAPTLSVLTLSAPMLGTGDVPPILGVGDVVMSALYVAAAARFGLPERRTLVALGAGLGMTMLAVLALELPLPALPFLGVAIVVAHPATRLPPTHERRQAAAGVVVVVLVVAWLFLGR